VSPTLASARLDTRERQIFGLRYGRLRGGRGCRADWSELGKRDQILSRSLIRLREALEAQGEEIGRSV
jgi:hypothetical protein